MKSSVRTLVNRYFRRKGLPLQPALTFADVIIEDNFSPIRSRSDIRDLRVRLARNVFLNIPVVSANMTTVTDSKMAIALARLGGLGFIHQFFSLDQRVQEVKKVKRTDNALIEDPVTVLDTATLGQAREQMKKYEISSVLVVDENGKLVGILTHRDYRFKEDNNLPVKQIMKSGLTLGYKGMDREKAFKIMDERRLEKLPLVGKGFKLAGLITTKDLHKEKEIPNAIRDRKGRLMVGAGIRLNGNYLEEVRELVKAGADVILLDTARANSAWVRNATMEIKKHFPKIPLVVGNIDTPEAALMLIKAGADCLKIGIGPGSACKTREATGIGIPQITAVASCAAVARKYDIPVIADGGIRGGNDLSKALVAGANAVMLGSLLAGTDESPGNVETEEGRRFKWYLGSASAEHQLDRMQIGSLDSKRASEGVARKVPATGPVQPIVDELFKWLRSAMSYVGAKNVPRFQKLGKFVWQTRSGYDEGKPQA